MTDRIIIKPEAFAESAKKAAQVRHAIHRRPEIGLNLTETEKTIVEALKSFGCEEVYTRVGGSEVSGVVCVIKGDEPGRTIGLRADSDALPLNENTGAPYSSEKPKHTAAKAAYFRQNASLSMRAFSMRRSTDSKRLELVYIQRSDVMRAVSAKTFSTCSTLKTLSRQALTSTVLSSVDAMLNLDSAPIVADASAFPLP